MVLCGLKDSPKLLIMIFSSTKIILSLQAPNQPGTYTIAGTPSDNGFPSIRITASRLGSPNLSYKSDVGKRSIPLGNSTRAVPRRSSVAVNYAIQLQLSTIKDLVRLAVTMGRARQMSSKSRVT